MSGSSSPSQFSALAPPLGALEDADPPLGAQELEDPPLGAQELEDPPLGPQELEDPPLGGQEDKVPPLGLLEKDAPALGMDVPPLPIEEDDPLSDDKAVLPPLPLELWVAEPIRKQCIKDCSTIIHFNIIPYI